MRHLSENAVGAIGGAHRSLVEGCHSPIAVTSHIIINSQMRCADLINSNSSLFMLVFQSTVNHCPSHHVNAFIHTSHICITTTHIINMDEFLIPLRTPCVYHDPNFLPTDEATAAYQDLLENTPWEKTAKINRWVTLMELPKNASNVDEKEEADGDDTDEKKGTGYRYRDAPGETIIGFPPTVYKLKLLAEEWYNSKQTNDGTANAEAKVEFNVCLLNYYQDGTQRIGWHSDREELGRTTPIASISLGATRSFLIRSQTDGVHDRASLDLENGSIVVMENVCQREYVHSVPKEGEVVGGRINLTFRCKQDVENGTTAGELEHEKRDHWIDAISTEDGALDSTAGAWKNDVGAGGVSGLEYDGVVKAASEGEVFGDNTEFFDPSTISTESLQREIEYAVRTNIGAESYCAAELEEVLDTERYGVIARPFGIAGYVAVCRIEGVGDEEMDAMASQVTRALLQLRTAHHVLRYHDHFDLNDVLSSLPTTREEEGKSPIGLSSIDGEMLYQYYKDKLVSNNASIQSLVDLDSGTFRVTCDRTGSHKFQAPEVER